MKCIACYKQLITVQTEAKDKYATTLINSKRGFQQQIHCGHCSQDIDFDENGNTALERIQCERFATSSTP